jgi:hypothetical protein
MHLAERYGEGVLQCRRNMDFQYDVEMKVPLSRQWKKKEGTNGK